ncbi:MAG: DUF2971 domain-containing protein [Paracoccaceae bacterium]
MFQFLSPHGPVPRVVYRFRRIQRFDASVKKFTTDIVEQEIAAASHHDCGVYFSSISDMSDTFEARPRIVSADELDIYKFIKFYWHNLGDAPILKAIIDSVGLAGIEDFDRTAFAKRPLVVERLRSFARILLPEARDMTRIACFVEDCTSSSMWDYYADYGRGIAFEFSLRSQFQSNDGGQYGPNSPRFAMVAHGFHYGPIIYTDQVPSVSDLEILMFHPSSVPSGADHFTHQIRTQNDIKSFIERVGFTKPLSYQSEKEWRITMVGREAGYYRFIPYSLSSIILGLSVPSADETLICVLAAKAGIRVKKMRRKIGTFELEAVVLN